MRRLHFILYPPARALLLSLIESPNYVVYAQRFDRLTSRLEGLIASWRFARALGRKLIFSWPQPYGFPDGDYRPETIFDLDAMARSPESADLTIEFKRRKPPKGTPDFAKAEGWPHSLNQSTLRELKADLYLLAVTGLGFAGERAAEIQAEKRRLFRLILPHPVILDNLERALSWIGPAPFIGVHIRRGDIMAKMAQTMTRYVELLPPADASPDERLKVDQRLKDWIVSFSRRVAPVELFTAAAQKESHGPGPSPRFVVFSDCDETAARFQDSLPGREVLLMSAFPTTLTELQRAWLEVLILMRAKKILVTLSTFGVFAGAYGGVPLVHVRPPGEWRKMEFFFNQHFKAQLCTSPALQHRCRKLLHAALWDHALGHYGKILGRFFSLRHAARDETHLEA